MKEGRERGREERRKRGREDSDRADRLAGKASSITSGQRPRRPEMMGCLRHCVST